MKLAFRSPNFEFRETAGAVSRQMILTTDSYFGFVTSDFSLWPTTEMFVNI
jgi:hypothetical protein